MDVASHSQATSNLAPLVELAGTTWDAIVVGAGPAGCIAARQLARAGLGVLLIDRAVFPRAKVCGCCLSAATLSILDSLGLGHVPGSLSARGLDSIDLRAGRARARIPIPAGAACSRSAFDAALAHEAVRAGALFHDSTTASLISANSASPTLLLRTAATHATVHARAIIAADGLAGSLFREPISSFRFQISDCKSSSGSSSKSSPSFPSSPCPSVPSVVKSSIHPRSRIGFATILDHPPLPARLDDHTIHMFSASRGYVGAVHLEDGRLNLAAAVDPTFVSESGGPANAMAAILAACGATPPDLAAARWHGTPALTRRRRAVALPGLFFIGDAAGYVEPFTGEGMAWAIAGGAEVVPHVVRACEGDAPGAARAWNRRHRRLIARRRTLAALAASVLRRPRLAGAAVRLVATAPAIGAAIARAAQHSRDLSRDVGDGAVTRRLVARESATTRRLVVGVESA